MNDVILPPFHLASEQGTQDLFAVAFVTGEYAGPDGSGGQACFSVIYLRPSGMRQPFCLLSVNADGRTFNYSNPRVKNIDQMFMWAWDENGVSPAEWTLYCEQVSGIAAQIADPPARRSYQGIIQGAAETIELFYRRRLGRQAGEAAAVRYGIHANLGPLFRFRTGRQQSALTLAAGISDLNAAQTAV